MAHRLLVVDDDPAVTRALSRGLSFEGFEVQTACTGSDAITLVEARPPHLVILDIMLPGPDGLEVLDRLKEAHQRLPVLLLTARDTPAEQVHGLRRGADDYVVKPFSFEVLVARVRTLLRRFDVPPVLQFADLVVDTGSREVSQGGRAIALTPTEYELLVQLMEHPRRVLTRRRLMQRVWNYDFGRTANVLEVYISQLRHKLEEAGEPRLIHTVRGAGYALREP